MLTAKTISEYIISQSSSDDREVTNLKLQKLLYYCQGFHIAIKDESLFNEPIEHWDHGPVVPAMYHEYKKNGKEPLTPSNNVELSIPKDSKDIIDEVLNVYGQFAAWKLRDMTHNELPWASTNDCQEITPEILKSYFITRIRTV